MGRTIGEVHNANKMFLWKPSRASIDPEVVSNRNKQTTTPSERMCTRLRGVSGCKGF